MGAITCSLCPAGWFVDGEECKSCLKGTYQSCIVSKYSESVGASAESTCKLCVLGFEQKKPGMSYCLPCTPGKKGVADSGGYSICETCGNNYFSH